MTRETAGKSNRAKCNFTGRMSRTMFYGYALPACKLETLPQMLLLSFILSLDKKIFLFLTVTQLRQYSSQLLKKSKCFKITSG
jgi:hypothetical protein